MAMMRLGSEPFVYLTGTDWSFREHERVIPIADESHFGVDGRVATTTFGRRAIASKHATPHVERQSSSRRRP